MKVIIAGCGKIGKSVIVSLISEGFDVVAVDNNESVVSELTNTLDVMCVCGNATDSETLKEAGAEMAELFVAATASDEINMLACFIARRLGAKHTVARIRNPEYNGVNLGFLQHELELTSSINPEFITANAIFSALKLADNVKTEGFAGGRFELVELELSKDSPLCEKSLVEINKEKIGRFLVCAVKRGEDVYIPDGKFVLKEGDVIGLTASADEMHRLLKTFGGIRKGLDSVMLLGAGRISHYLAKMLIAAGISVKVIDSDPQSCARFSVNVPSAVVIRGDGSSHDLLEEEGISTTDAFVAATGIDEENILLSVYAASTFGTVTVTKINSESLVKMAGGLGLQKIASPQMLISDVIASYARALHNTEGSDVETLYKVMDGKAEALEFKVLPDFKYCGVPLREMKLKSNILVGGIVRGRKTIIPSGDDVFNPEDRVVVISAGTKLDDLSDIMR